MNNVTVGLCFFPDVPAETLSAVRAKIAGCAYFVDFPTPQSQRRDGLGRLYIRPPEGMDLAVIICDNTPVHTEYNVLGLTNGLTGDPWATLTITVASPTWKGPQPTIAVESARYMGYHHVTTLQDDLSVMLLTHRVSLFNRGLSRKDWEFIRLVESRAKL